MRSYISHLILSSPDKCFCLMYQFWTWKPQLMTGRQCWSVADVLLSVTNYTQSTDSQTIRMLNVALNHSYLMGNLTLPEEVKTVELLMKNQIQHFESNLLKTATQKWRPLTLLPLCFYSQRKWPQLVFSFLQNQTQTLKTNHKIFKSVQ